MFAGLGWVAREAGLRRRVNPGESQFFNHLRVESVEGERSLQADGRSLMIQRVGLCVDLAGQEERCLLLRKPVAERFEQAAHLRGLLAQVSASRDKGEVGGKVEGGGGELARERPPPRWARAKRERLHWLAAPPLGPGWKAPEG